MKDGNVILDRSYAFAVRIVNLYQHLSQEKKECVLSKQILRCGTSAQLRNAHRFSSGQEVAPMKFQATFQFSNGCILPSTPCGSHMVAQGRFDPGFTDKMRSRPASGRTAPARALCDPQGVEQQSNMRELRSGALDSTPASGAAATPSGSGFITCSDPGCRRCGSTLG